MSQGQRLEGKCNRVKVGIFLMQKDEQDLFPTFIKYYGEAFGYSNIHVFDNGSSESMQDMLNDAGALGVRINQDFNTAEDYENKGAVLGQAINENRKKYDISLPLDCDEFIALKSVDGSYSCNAEDLINYFDELPPGGYKTSSRFRNNLVDLEKFYVSPGVAKLFFKKMEVKGLNVGAHKCVTPKAIGNSRICHFEMHNKPFETLQKHALSKMKLRIDVSDVRALRKYRGKGIHMIPYLLENAEETYYLSFKKQNWFHSSALQQTFSFLGLKHPFASLLKDGEELKFISPSLERKGIKITNIISTFKRHALNIKSLKKLVKRF